MSWGQWWPHDPVVKTDSVDPYLVKVEKNKVLNIILFIGIARAGRVKLNHGVMEDIKE
ncbi:hypothetical protein [Plasmodium yoelii yoelii]|uniref:Uncharacterized protein n=1 Tax=Plasmodium yoelii yoelii TaxID=73239 RepID=Q7RNZ6_PLAYO|nr:hypothetical protein [Plasmodium yoelii yoelii]